MAYTTIDDPSAHFQTAIYSGNSSTLAVTSQGNATIAPDWIWVKRRNSTSTHALVDSSRGRAKSLGSESNDAEYNTSDTAKDLISFDTNGFTVGPANQRNMNGNGDTFVAWQWKANGGTTSSNTDGSITSTVQANTDAGFSIVTYTGTGSSSTAGHGLNSTPEIILSKSRNTDEQWALHTTVIDGSVDFLRISETDAKGNSSFSAPNSTVFPTRPNENYITYIFHSVKGYSKFGSYKGNGNADGAFIYLGFKPKFVIGKSSSRVDAWFMHDTTRSTFNPVDDRLMPHLNYAEGAEYDIDFLSNGYKIRDSEAQINGDGETYIYLAFAEHPFVSSKGVPTTAR